MKQKICVVTGANRGIGLALTRGMAAEGFHVVMLCRNAESGEAAKASLLTQQPDASLEVMLCDLASQRSMRAFVQTFEARYDKLDVLINNAAILPFGRRETDDGLELVFAVNYFSAFFLGYLLRERLRAAAPARIVNVVGKLHFKGKLRLDDLQLTRHYNTLKAGTQAVLAKAVLTFEWERRFAKEGIHATCFHPGTVDTGLARHAPALIRWLAGLLKPWKLSPDEGAAPGVLLASSPDYEGKGGLYLHCMKAAEASDDARDAALGEQLWEASMSLIREL